MTKHRRLRDKHGIVHRRPSWRETAFTLCTLGNERGVDIFAWNLISVQPSTMVTCLECIGFASNGYQR